MSNPKCVCCGKPVSLKSSHAHSWVKGKKVFACPSCNVGGDFDRYLDDQASKQEQKR